MKLKGVFLATFVLLFVFVPLGRLNAALTSMQYSPNNDNGLRINRSPTQSIVVPEGFRVTLIASGLSPIGTWSNYPNSLQDLEPGRGDFGSYLYFIDNGVIYRIATPGGQSQPFAYVPAALVMRFGFDGDLFVGTATGKVMRVFSDGTTSLFAQVGTSIEGMAFDTSSGSAYSSRLFVSEWIDGGHGRVSAIDASGLVQVFISPGSIGIETAGLEFCGSIPRLYAVDQPGTIFEISNTGSVSLLGGIDLQSQIQYAETLACSKENTSFGNYLYLAEQGYQPAGRILRVSTDGAIEVFASGFQGFDGWGVTGLKFSSDGRTLYVTDDVGRSIYAIQSSDVVQEARLDIGMPYDANRGCTSSYIGCSGPFHGFYRGVCTDLVLDAYRAGAPFDIQGALLRDGDAYPGRYLNGTARRAEDMRLYFDHNQQFLQHSEPYYPGDIAFFDWGGDGLTDHVLVISEVDATGRPVRMVDASGIIPYGINPSGLAFEHNWSNHYEQHIQGHARLNSTNLWATSILSESLQILRVTISPASAGLSVFDSNGKSVSETYNENFVASNVETFIPYIPRGSYESLNAHKIITITRPLSNTSQYFVRIEGLANATYTLHIETQQDTAVTASQTFTQAIDAGENHNIGVTLTAPNGTISFTTQPPMTIPVVVVPASLSLRGLVGTSAQFNFPISEIGGQEAISNASITVTDLWTQYGIKISSNQLTITPFHFNLTAGGTQEIDVQVSLADLNPGEYLGSLILTMQNGNPMVIPLTLQVQYHKLYLPCIFRN